MVTFYLIEIAKGDQAIAGKAVYEYAAETRDAAWTKAMVSYHKKMGVAMGSDMYNSELIVIMDENGAELLCEKYEKPVTSE